MHTQMRSVIMDNMLRTLMHQTIAALLISLYFSTVTIRPSNFLVFLKCDQKNKDADTLLRKMSQVAQRGHYGE